MKIAKQATIYLQKHKKKQNKKRNFVSYMTKRRKNQIKVINNGKCRGRIPRSLGFLAIPRLTLPWISKISYGLMLGIFHWRMIQERENDLKGVPHMPIRPYNRGLTSTPRQRRLKVSNMGQYLSTTESINEHL